MDPHNNGRGPVVLANLSADDAALLLRQIPEELAATWLGALQPKDLPAAVQQLHDDEILSLLKRMKPGPEITGQLVHGFGEDELTRLLTQLPGAEIEDWLNRLRTGLSTPATNLLRKAARQQRGQ
jgi:hypothetical protein